MTLYNSISCTLCKGTILESVMAILSFLFPKGTFSGSQRIKFTGSEEILMYRASSLFQVQFDELSTVMKEYFANNRAELVSMCDSKKGN